MTFRKASNMSENRKNRSFSNALTISIFMKKNVIGFRDILLKEDLTLKIGINNGIQWWFHSMKK